MSPDVTGRAVYVLVAGKSADEPELMANVAVAVVASSRVALTLIEDLLFINDGNAVNVIPVSSDVVYWMPGGTPTEAHETPETGDNAASDIVNEAG
jgi:hypothetical protein